MKKPEATVTRDETLINRVRAGFENVSNVKEKKMFGSTAFMVGGRMCVSVRAGRIMCRVDPSLHEGLVKIKGCRTVEMGGRKYPGYIYVDAAALGPKRALNHWIELAVKFNRAQQMKMGTASGAKSSSVRRKPADQVSRRVRLKRK